MTRILTLAAAAALLLGSSAWADSGKDSPSDADNGGGNQPHAPGQTTNPNPGKLWQDGPAWLSGYVVADTSTAPGQSKPSGPQGPGQHGSPGPNGNSGP